MIRAACLCFPILILIAGCGGGGGGDGGSPPTVSDPSAAYRDRLVLLVSDEESGLRRLNADGSAVDLAAATLSGTWTASGTALNVSETHLDAGLDGHNDQFAWSLATATMTGSFQVTFQPGDSDTATAYGYVLARPYADSAIAAETVWEDQSGYRYTLAASSGSGAVSASTRPGFANGTFRFGDGALYLIVRCADGVDTDEVHLACVRTGADAASLSGVMAINEGGVPTFTISTSATLVAVPDPSATYRDRLVLLVSDEESGLRRLNADGTAVDLAATTVSGTWTANGTGLAVEELHPDLGGDGHQDQFAWSLTGDPLTGTFQITFQPGDSDTATGYGYVLARPYADASLAAQTVWEDQSGYRYTLAAPSGSGAVSASTRPGFANGTFRFGDGALYLIVRCADGVYTDEVHLACVRTGADAASLSGVMAINEGGVPTFTISTSATLVAVPAGGG